MREKLNGKMSRIRFVEFPEFLVDSVVPEPNSIPLTAALQHRTTAAPKLGGKGGDLGFWIED